MIVLIINENEEERKKYAISMRRGKNAAEKVFTAEDFLHARVRLRNESIDVCIISENLLDDGFSKVNAFIDKRCPFVARIITTRRKNVRGYEEAIRVRALGYFETPVMGYELKNAILHSRENPDTKIENALLKRKNEILKNDLSVSIHQNIICSLLNKDYMDVTLKHPFFDKLGREGAVCVIFMHLGFDVEKDADKVDKLNEFLKKRISGFESGTGPLIRGIMSLYFLNLDKVVEGSLTKSGLERYMQDFARNLSRDIRAELDIDVVMGIDVEMKLKNIYECAQNALNNLYVNQEYSGAIHIVGGRRAKRFENMSKLRENLYLEVRKGSKEAVSVFSNIVSACEELPLAERKNIIVGIIAMTIEISAMNSFNTRKVSITQIVKVIDVVPESRLYTWAISIYTEIINIISRNLPRTDNGQIEKVLEYVDRNYEKKITSEEAARIAGVSNEHFCRLFKKKMGKSFVQYINSLRVGAAAEKMFGYKKSVGELAEEVGFSDANYFSRVFKNAFGMSPEKYMKFIKDV